VVANLLINLLNLVMIVFVVQALLSWFPIRYDSPIRPLVEFLHRLTDPILTPLRKVIPPMGGLDWSSLVVILGIRMVLIPLVARLNF